ncbi:MAG: hypothetical protein QW096_09245 [Thermofilaceae archaeon]
MLKPHVIVFAGTVGAGKSTQMRLLASALRMKGLRVKTTFLLKGHLLSYFLEIILAKILCKREHASSMRALLDESPYRFKKLFKVWLAFDVLSTCLKFLFSILIPLKLGYFILVEEYIPSTVSNYLYYCQCLRLPITTINFPSNLLLRLMLSIPTHVIFLDSCSEALKSRWKARMSPIEKDSYIYMRRKVTLPLLQTLLPGKTLYLRTDNQTIYETFKSIREWLGV